MDKLKELQAKLVKAQADLGEVFKQAGDNLDFSKVTCIAGTDEEKAAAVRKMNDECARLQKEMEPLMSVEKARREWQERNNVLPIEHPQKETNSSGGNLKMLSFGEAFIKTGAHKKENRGKEFMLDESVNLKTLFETAAGWAVENLRSGRIVLDEQRPVQVIDLLPKGETSQAAVVYMEETTFTNNAAEASEGGTYGESALALTEQTSTVRKVAVFIPVTDEQLEDVRQVQGYLDNRLRFMIMQRLDNQVINGNGSAPNLTGILNVSGLQSQAKGTDIITDAIFKGMTKVRVTGRAIPSGVIIHPNDWEEIRLMKTVGGVYMWGHPAEAGPERIFGVAVAQADSIAEGTAIVGDFRQFIELTERQGIEVKVGYNNDDFTKGKQSVRADLRVALPIYRPKAFCQVTGL